MEPLFLQIKHLLGSTDVDDVVADDVVADAAAAAEDVACCSCLLLLSFDVEVLDVSVVVVDNLIDFRFPCSFSFFLIFLFFARFILVESVKYL